MIWLPARTIVRLRYVFIALWIVIAIFAIPRASHVLDVLDVEGTSRRVTEAGVAQNIIRREFPEPFTHFFAVAVHGEESVDSPDFLHALSALTATAEAEPYIGLIVSREAVGDDDGFVSDDRLTTFFAAAILDAHADTATDLVPAFRRAIHRTADHLPHAERFQVFVTGNPALDYDVRTVSKDDAERGEKRALPLVAVVLVLAFGALVAAILPILVALFAITCALALVHVASAFQPMSVFVLNIVTMIGLGVGIDYSLLIVTRFREELNRGLGRREAAARSVRTAGRAVVTSGMAVVVGFAALLFTPLSETRSVAVGGIFVVAVAVALSVTLLPGVLAIMGRAIDAPRGLARRLAWYHAPARWERWARWLAHHPWGALAIGAVIIAAITWPLADINIGLPRSGWFPSHTESARGLDQIEHIGVRGALQPIRVVIAGPEGERVVGSRYLRTLRRLSDQIKDDPRVAQVRGVVDLQPGTSILQYTMLYSDIDRARERHRIFLNTYLSRDNSTTVMDVMLADTVSFTGGQEMVRSIRGMLREQIDGNDGLRTYVGGFQASTVDLQDDLLKRFPLLIASVLIVTAVALGIAFQSVLVPIKAVLMNCLSVGGAFGLIVLVFQKGVGAGLFGLEEGVGAVYVVVPVLVFAVVFGLSMDYEIFLLSRIKEAYDRSGKNTQATMEGLSATASVITSAALIMIIVFGIFSFSNVLVVQLIGFGLAVAVFLDATLIRMVLVPAFMHIAGNWNWWPGVRPHRGKVAAQQPGGEQSAPPGQRPSR